MSRSEILIIKQVSENQLKDPVIVKPRVFES